MEIWPNLLAIKEAFKCSIIVEEFVAYHESQNFKTFF